jgi:hypothetical protein
MGIDQNEDFTVAIISKIFFRQRQYFLTQRYLTRVLTMRVFQSWKNPPTRIKKIHHFSIASQAV